MKEAERVSWKDEFPKIVRTYFDPVSLAAGMTCSMEDYWKVRYESSKSFMDIVFDGTRSYEFDVIIGEQASKQRPEQAFSLWLILGSTAAQGSLAGTLRAINRDEMIAAVCKLSSIVIANASPFLKGETAEFDRLAAFVAWSSLKYAWDTHQTVSAKAYDHFANANASAQIIKNLSAEDLELLGQIKRALG